MIFSIGYSIVSIGIFFLVYLVVSKKWCRLTIRKPLIISVVNFLLAALVSLLYLSNPASFSSNITIDNKIAYILFSFFAIYFYIFIIPLAGVQIIVTLKNNLYEKSYKKYIILGLNLVTITAIVYITTNIF